MLDGHSRGSTGVGNSSPSIRVALLYAFMDILSFEPYLNPVGKKEVVLTTFCTGRTWDSEVSTDSPQAAHTEVHSCAQMQVFWLQAQFQLHQCRQALISSFASCHVTWEKAEGKITIHDEHGLHSQRGTNTVGSEGSKVQLQMLSWYLWLGVAGRRRCFPYSGKFFHGWVSIQVKYETLFWTLKLNKLTKQEEITSETGIEIAFTGLPFSCC